MKTVIRYKANNDVNGNPRRVYAIYEDGVLVESYNEGYRGWGAVPEEYRDMASMAETVDVSVSEYNRILRRGRNNGQD
jgi:hypothetical protein